MKKMIEQLEESRTVYEISEFSGCGEEDEGFPDICM